MTDRNFDDLAERFARRVYGGLKGEIRLAVLWADLEPLVTALTQQRGAPLRILDVGGGLAQLAIRLAQLGHRVTVNDLSATMLNAARQHACELGLEQSINWICAPYQTLTESPQQPYDLVLCHALLEWLDSPKALIPSLTPLLLPDGYLSLCFYNPAAKIYRNLIRGNFDWLQSEQPYRSDRGSLTPNNPCYPQQVRQWLETANLKLESESGLRVFSDYVVDKRGGLQDPKQVLAMELAYSHEEPFKWLGRYLHFVARRC